jgi:hypothetical protein
MADFNCMYSHGFLRVAACVPRGRVADPDFAATEHLALAAQGSDRHVAVMLFPELGLSSYAIDDLLFQDALLDKVEQALARIAAASRELYPALVVGAPLRHAGQLFNTAVVIYRGTTIQSTQQVVGPFALQDFNLFYLTRYGFRPSRIAFMAERAWGDVNRGSWPSDIPDSDRCAYSLDEIRHWLEVFLARFFANQFKRSALPNGPKISSGGSLSPRGDWRAPSDATAGVWLEELARALPPRR